MKSETNYYLLYFLKICHYLEDKFKFCVSFGLRKWLFLFADHHSVGFTRSATTFKPPWWYDWWLVSLMSPKHLWAVKTWTGTCDTWHLVTDALELVCGNCMVPLHPMVALLDWDVGSLEDRSKPCRLGHILWAIPLRYLWTGHFLQFCNFFCGCTYVGPLVLNEIYGHIYFFIDLTLYIFYFLVSLSTLISYSGSMMGL